MTSRAPLVHIGALKMHILLRLLDLLKDVLRRINGHWQCILHFFITDLGLVRVGTVLVSQQVDKVLFIYLKVIQVNLKGCLFKLDLFVHIFKEIIHSPRYDSIVLYYLFWNILLATPDGINDFLRSEHTICLTRATLPIRKYRSIKTFGELLDSFSSCAGVHDLLALAMQDMIKCESVTIWIVFALWSGDLIVLVALPAIRITLIQLFITLEPYYDLDVVMFKFCISRWPTWPMVVNIHFL